MFCHQCGTELPRVAKFCPVCGTPVDRRDGNGAAGTKSSPSAAKTPDNASKENARAAKQQNRAASKAAKANARAAEKAEKADARKAEKQAKAAENAAKANAKAAKAKSHDAQSNGKSGGNTPKKKRKWPKAVIVAAVIIAVIAVIGSYREGQNLKTGGENSSFSSAEQYAKLDSILQKELGSSSFAQLGIEERVEKTKSVLRDARDNGLIAGEILYYEPMRTFSFTYADGTLGGVDLQRRRDSNPPTNLTSAELSRWASGFAGDIANLPEPDAIDGLSSHGPSILVLCSFESERQPVYDAISKRWNGFGLHASVKNGAKVSDLKDFAGYDIVMFSMHGTQLGENPVICPQEHTTSANDDSYFKELETDHSIARVWVEEEKCMHYYVTPKFFTNSLSEDGLDDAIVFSESCMFLGGNGADVKELFPQALMDRGARSVFGMYNSVMAEYSLLVCIATIEHLLEGYTLADSFAAAQRTYGADDSEKGYRPSDYPEPTAYPLLFGDTAVKYNITGKQAQQGAPASDLAGWGNGYYWFIERGDYLDTAAYYLPESVSDDYYPIEFGMYDMNDDHIPELIAYNGSEVSADAGYYLYTYRDGKVVLLGECGYGLDSHFSHGTADGYHGLFYVNGRRDDDMATYYRFDGNALSSELVYRRNIDTGAITRETANDGLYAASSGTIPVLMYNPDEIIKMGWEGFVGKMQ